MAEYGPINDDDDPMIKKFSSREVVEDAKDKAKEKVPESKEDSEPRSLFEMLKGKKDTEEDDQETNPFLKFLRQAEADEETSSEEEKAEKTESDAEEEPAQAETEDSAEEAEDTVAELESAEVTEVAESYAESTIEDAESELESSEPGTVEEAEAAASIAFAEAIKDKAESGEAIDDDALDEVAETVASDLDMENSEELVGQEATEETAGEAGSLDAEPGVLTFEGTEADHEEQVAEEQAEDIADSPELSDDEDSEEDSSSSTTTSNPSQSSSQQQAQPSSSGNNGGNTPPPNTNYPYGAGGGFPPSPGMSSPNIVGPSVASANMLGNNLNSVDTRALERRAAAKGLLVGGLVGYMVGRRRGRIRTEEKLLPIQKKLEKNVSELHDKLTEKEMKLRRMAAQQFEHNQLRSLKQLEKIQQMRERKLDHTKTQEAVRASGVEQSVDLSNSNAERSVEQKFGSSEAKADSQERMVSPRSVETMSIPLLLALAETIVVGETSLRTMYEKGTLNQDQLRRITKEYLNGERIDKVLPEILGQETLNEQAHNVLKDDASASEFGDGNAQTVFNQHQPNQQYVNPNLAPESDKPHRELSPAVRSILEDQEDEKRLPLPMITVVVVIAIVFALIIVFAL